ncbi:hypothetical protein IMY05_016G0056100 [Salix suchowensis]|nr:hypothetical protein IMY05_016G0056100 [Salix suchowensis]
MKFERKNPRRAAIEFWLLLLSIIKTADPKSYTPIVICFSNKINKRPRKQKYVLLLLLISSVFPCFCLSFPCAPSLSPPVGRFSPPSIPSCLGLKNDNNSLDLPVHCK